MAATATLDFESEAWEVFKVIVSCEKYSGFKFEDNPSNRSKVTAVFRNLGFGWDFRI
jgi:hypothetical protein